MQKNDVDNSTSNTTNFDNPLEEPEHFSETRRLVSFFPARWQGRTRLILASRVRCFGWIWWSEKNVG